MGAMGPLLFALSCCEKQADEDFVVHQKSSGEVLPQRARGVKAVAQPVPLRLSLPCPVLEKAP